MFNQELSEDKKKKQSWILCYGSQQECNSIDMVESFPKNKVLGFVGGVFVCLQLQTHLSTKGYN